METVKEKKIKLLNSLDISDLKKISNLERIETEGSKEELINRIASKLKYIKIKNYVKKILLQKKFNIFQHELVPKHRILSKEEKEEILKKYGATLKQLPRIYVTDPVVIALGAKPGDVIEVIRKSQVAGEAKYYRVVVRPKS